MDVGQAGSGAGGRRQSVRVEGYNAADVHARMEAGTQPEGEMVGWDAAIDWREGRGMEAVAAEEGDRTAYARRTLTERFGEDLFIHGPSTVEERGGTLSLAYRTIHPHALNQ